MNDEKFCRIGEALDRLISTDVSARGAIVSLYQAARKLTDKPLTYNVASLLVENVKPKDKVILATGWIDQPEAAPNFGETDGPSGTIALARALRLNCQAACIVYTNEKLVDGLKKIAQTAGFHCVEPNQLNASIELNKLMTISILPFSEDWQIAKEQAKKALDEYQPACCIAVECGGMDDEGKIYSMSGTDTSPSQAKIDYLFQEAYQKGILTIGIGDGGNEVGMANIKESLPNIDLAPTTKVNALLTAVISNWGCYAVSDMLAALKNNLYYLYTPDMEERMLRNSADNGFHDAIYGGVEYSVDGCTVSVSRAMVEVMREVVEQGMKRF